MIISLPAPPVFNNMLILYSGKTLPLFVTRTVARNFIIKIAVVMEHVSSSTSFYLYSHHIVINRFPENITLLFWYILFGTYKESNRVRDAS